MTEIPEHLLKRSRERRAALGLGGEGGEGTPPSEPAGEGATPPASSSAPVPVAAAATPVPVEEAEPEPPKPVPAYIQAAQRRRRVPYWAMPVLAALPLWAYVYVSTLEPPPAAFDPVALGSEVYGTCAGCHGSDGSGSAAIPGFTDGAVVETFPDPIDQMVWVRLGAQGYPGDTYGAQDKAESSGTMPPHAGLSDQELAQVVLYERRVLGGEAVELAPEDDVLLQIASGELTFAEAFAEDELAPLAKAAGLTEDDLLP